MNPQIGKPRFNQGMVFQEKVELTPEFVEEFAKFSGDRNPLHLKQETALLYGFARPVAHGAIQSAIVSRIIGMKVPGPGAIWMNQSMEWLKPVFVGDFVRVEVEIESISGGAEVLGLCLRAYNGSGDQVMQGSAKVKMGVPVAENAIARTSKGSKVALVTGGSRGIGAAIVKRLAEDGFKVAIAFHSKQRSAEAIAEGILANGGEAFCCSADLGEEGGGSKLVREVVEHFGAVDVLVHAATSALPNGFIVDKSVVQDWKQCSHIHLESALEMLNEAAPGMIERKFGRFIFLGTSYLFGTPPSKMAAYVMAKHALWGAVRYGAVELGPSNITVNMISPGMTVTELTSDIPSRLKEVEARKTAVRRLALPVDIAGTVAFLASDEASYITGQNIPLTGGPV